MFTRNLPTVFTTLFLNILFIFNAKAQIFESVGQFVSDSSCEILFIQNAQGGKLYTLGYMSGNTDIDPGPGTQTVNTNYGRVFLTKSDTGGAFHWYKTFADTIAYRITAVKTDIYDNIYLAGQEKPRYTPANDFIYPNFIIKCDPQGNMIWRTTFGNNAATFGSSTINQIHVLDDGSVFTCGEYDENEDLIPGNTVEPSPTSQNSSGFLQKFDQNGNLVWLRRFWGLADPLFTSITGSGADLYVYGRKIYHTDATFENTPVSFPFINAASFILKADTSGNLQWIKSIDAGALPYEIILSNSGEYLYCSGTVNYITDFDPGPGQFVVDNPVSGQFILKLDTAANFQWVRPVFDGRGYEYAGGRVLSLAIDAQDNAYLISQFGADFDVDAGPGMHIETANGLDLHTYILSVTAAGDFSWSAAVKGSGMSIFHHLLVLPDQSLLLGGAFSGTNDFDPQTGVHNLTAAQTDGFLLRLRKDPCADLLVKTDSVSDLTCQALAGIYLHSIGGTAPYTYTWNNNAPTADSVFYTSTPGIHNVVLNDAGGCSRSLSFLMNGPLPVTDFDLEANLVTGSFQPGFTTQTELYLLNNTCIPATGQLMLVCDSALIFNSAIPAPSSVSGDTLIWDFSNFKWDTPFSDPKISFTTAASTPLSDTLNLVLLALPLSGDGDTSNNIRTYTIPVTGAYDPNDKKVYPAGECTPGYIQQDQTLTYTVRFQNTGSAPAHNVYIEDALSPALDLNSLQVIGASHDMYTKIMPGNVLHFMFDNIMLPDSNSNEPLSHGYVVFRVNPLPGSTPGSEIRNKVGIYFDYNAPVITNEVLNTIADSSYIGNHTQTTVSTANSSYTWHGVTYNASGTYTRVFQNVQGCDSTVVMTLSLNASSLAGYGQNGIRLFPNPAQDQLQLESKEHVNDGILRIYSITGQLVRERKNVSGTQFSIDLTGLAPDVYTLELYDGQQHRRSRFVKQ